MVGGRASGWVAPYVVANAAAVVLIAVVWAGAEASGREFALFTRDPLAGTDQPVYAGALSLVGVLVWWAGAVACLLAAWLRRGSRVHVPFLAAGLFTALLTLDDLFQAHENAIPAATGVDEKVVYLAYLVLFVVFVLLVRPLLRRPHVLALAAACALFAVSIGVDVAAVAFDLGEEGGSLHAAEDGAKLLGIVTWTMLFVQVSMAAIARPGAEP